MRATEELGTEMVIRRVEVEETLAESKSSMVAKRERETNGEGIGNNFRLPFCKRAHLFPIIFRDKAFSLWCERRKGF